MKLVTTELSGKRKETTVKKTCLVTMLLLSGLLVSCASTKEHENAVKPEVVEQSTDKTESETQESS